MSSRALSSCAALFSLNILLNALLRQTRRQTYRPRQTDRQTHGKTENQVAGVDAITRAMATCDKIGVGTIVKP